MKKDYIMDGKVVRKCDVNISKMNMFEYMYYEIFQWKIYQKLISGYVIENLIESLKYLGAFLFSLVQVILLPIILPISSISTINKSKANCNKSNINKI